MTATSTQPETRSITRTMPLATADDAWWLSRRIAYDMHHETLTMLERQEVDEVRYRIARVAGCLVLRRGTGSWALLCAEEAQGSEGPALTSLSAWVDSHGGRADLALRIECPLVGVMRRQGGRAAWLASVVLESGNRRAQGWAD